MHVDGPIYTQHMHLISFKYKYTASERQVTVCLAVKSWVHFTILPFVSVFLIKQFLFCLVAAENDINIPEVAACCVRLAAQGQFGLVLSVTTIG